MTDDGTETMTLTYRIRRKMWHPQDVASPVLLFGEVIRVLASHRTARTKSPKRSGAGVSASVARKPRRMRLTKQSLPNEPGDCFADAVSAKLRRAWQSARSDRRASDCLRRYSQEAIMDAQLLDQNLAKGPEPSLGLEWIVVEDEDWSGVNDCGAIFAPDREMRFDIDDEEWSNANHC